MLRYGMPNPWQVFDDVRERLEKSLGVRTDLLVNSIPTVFPVDVIEQLDHLEVLINLPGVDAQSITVALENSVLTVTAKLEKAPEGREYLWRERPTGEIRRSIPLPGRLSSEGTTASLENGVLTVRVNKTADAAVRTIPVQVGSPRNIPQS